MDKQEKWVDWWDKPNYENNSQKNTSRVETGCQTNLKSQCYQTSQVNQRANPRIESFGKSMGIAKCIVL